MVLAQLAVDFYIPVFSEYMRTGIVPNFPTRIAYGFTMVAAIHSLFSGFTLETLWQKARQDFEMLLRRVIDRHRHLHLS